RACGVNGAQPLVGEELQQILREHANRRTGPAHPRSDATQPRRAADRTSPLPRHPVSSVIATSRRNCQKGAESTARAQPPVQKLTLAGRPPHRGPSQYSTYLTWDCSSGDVDHERPILPSLDTCAALFICR